MIQEHSTVSESSNTDLTCDQTDKSNKSWMTYSFKIIITIFSSKPTQSETG